MEEVKKEEFAEKAVNRILLLLWVLIMTVGVAFFTWRAYPAALETWAYIIRLKPGIYGYPFSGQLADLALKAGWFVLMVSCCALCLDSAILSTMKYIGNIKVDLQAEIPESEEAVTEERVTEGAK